MGYLSKTVGVRRGWNYDGQSRSFLAYLRAMYRKPGFLGFLGAALLLAVAAGLHGPKLRSAVIAVGILVGIVIVGFVVWRVGTEDGVPRE